MFIVFVMIIKSFGSSYIKHKRMDHCGIASLKHDMEVVCEGHKKANILNEYFSSVFTREDDNVPCLPALVSVTLSLGWMVW